MATLHLPGALMSVSFSRKRCTISSSPLKQARWKIPSTNPLVGGYVLCQSKLERDGVTA
eukprot:m.115335 g.115335  ORF g.115335 m.115335 type:complete len:59 (-) comp12838_c0_seq19:284-460(-)